MAIAIHAVRAADGADGGRAADAARDVSYDRVSPYGISASARQTLSSNGVPGASTGTSKLLRVPAKYSPSSALSCVRWRGRPGASAALKRRWSVSSCCSSMRRSVNSSRHTPASVAPAIIGPMRRFHPGEPDAVGLGGPSRRLAERFLERLAEAAVRFVSRLEHRFVQRLAVADALERAGQPASPAVRLKRQSIPCGEIPAHACGIEPHRRGDRCSRMRASGWRSMRSRSGLTHAGVSSPSSGLHRRHGR